MALGSTSDTSGRQIDAQIDDPSSPTSLISIDAVITSPLHPTYLADAANNAEATFAHHATRKHEHHAAGCSALGRTRASPSSATYTASSDHPPPLQAPQAPPTPPG